MYVTHAHPTTRMSCSRLGENTKQTWSGSDKKQARTKCGACEAFLKRQPKIYHKSYIPLLLDLQTIKMKEKKIKKNKKIEKTRKTKKKRSRIR